MFIFIYVFLSYPTPSLLHETLDLARVFHDVKGQVGTDLASPAPQAPAEQTMAVQLRHQIRAGLDQCQ